MPELPEVEEVRRTLEPHLLNIRIAAVEVRRADFITPRKAPLARLTGKSIHRTLRHGKKLFCIAGDGQTLLIHLGMSGRVDCVPRETPIERHTHIILHLDGPMQIRLRDPRRFGGLWYYPTFDQARQREIAPLGPDALDLTPADLAHWRTSRGRLKQRLLSQRDVAGLGNIYVDESLWLTQLHPQQRISRITAESLILLVGSIHRVLRQSIDLGGTTLRDYRNVSDQPGRFARKLQAYGRAGKPCLRCGTSLRSTLIAARTTVFCPQCQRQR